MIVSHDSADTGRALSGSVWKDFDFLGATRGRHYFMFDDFVNNRPMVSGEAHGGWKSFIDTGGTLTGFAADGGVLRGTTDGTAEDQINMQGNSALGAVRLLAANGLLCFEARIRIGATTTFADFGLFIGLAVAAMEGDAAVVTNNTGAIVATAGVIGFSVLNADSTIVRTIYQAVSQAIGVVDATSGVIATATYYKFGFVYDPRIGNNNKKLTFYIDGTEVAAVVGDPSTIGATFPYNVFLAPLIAFTDGATSDAKTIDVDWVAVGAQLSD